MSNLFKMPLSPKDDTSHHGKFNGFREDGKLDGISGYGPVSQDAMKPSYECKSKDEVGFSKQITCENAKSEHDVNPYRNNTLIPMT